MQQSELTWLPCRLRPELCQDKVGSGRPPRAWHRTTRLLFTLAATTCQQCRGQQGRVGGIMLLHCLSPPQHTFPTHLTGDLPRAAVQSDGLRLLHQLQVDLVVPATLCCCLVVRGRSQHLVAAFQKSTLHRYGPASPGTVRLNLSSALHTTPISVSIRTSKQFYSTCKIRCCAPRGS